VCCIVSVLLFLGPRFGILLWWLVEPNRWERAFDSFFWPLLGFLFLPWTTLTFVAIGIGGVSGFDWVWMAIAVLADISMYSGGAYGNRDRYTQYAADK